MHRMCNRRAPVLILNSLGRDLRQIPDAQEVFLDPQSDVNFIFEILDRVEPEGAEEAAR
jgi:hypothetical protein